MTHPYHIEKNIQGSAPEVHPTSTVTAFTVLPPIEPGEILYYYSAPYVHVPSLSFQFAPLLIGGSERISFGLVLQGLKIVHYYIIK